VPSCGRKRLPPLCRSADSLEVIYRQVSNCEQARPEKLLRACFMNRLGSRNPLILMAQNRPIGIYETRSSLTSLGFQTGRPG
jgi:hypothetical protein